MGRSCELSSRGAALRIASVTITPNGVSIHTPDAPAPRPGAATAGDQLRDCDPFLGAPTGPRNRTTRHARGAKSSDWRAAQLDLSLKFKPWLLRRVGAAPAPLASARHGSPCNVRICAKPSTANTAHARLSSSKNAGAGSPRRRLAMNKLEMNITTSLGGVDLVSWSRGSSAAAAGAWKRSLLPARSSPR